MTVNNVNALLNYVSRQQTPQADQTGIKQDESTKNSFGQAMTKAGDTIRSLHAEAAGTTVAAAQPAQDVKAAPARDAAQTKSADQADNTVQDSSDKPVQDDSGKTGDAAKQSDNKAVEDTEAQAGTNTDEAAQDVEEAAKELVKDIADEMDVTPEEVEEVMAALGLVPADLFDLNDLRQLMLSIAGGGDEVSLVTDEKLYESMKDLFGVVEQSLGDLQEELGLSEEELKDLLAQMAQEEKTPAEDVQTPEQMTGETAEQMPEVNLEGMKDYAVTVQKEGRTVRVEVTVDDAGGAKSVQEEVTDVPEEEAADSHKTRERNTAADNGRGEGNAAGNSAGNAFMQMSDKPVQMLEMPAAPVSAGYQSVQTQEIMDQITEYMKINLKADVQEMELQLHPASLGTVNVQIASKDGAVTAQFTTQNETVRAVIETQLVQLKQQFEEQGIKVDAVEVTVANHEYGQQFSQENGDTGNMQNRSSKGTRRINLDEIGAEEDLEEMEESERIAVEMMQANGNTVDYTA